jgi:hypothetical protein
LGQSDLRNSPAIGKRQLGELQNGVFAKPGQAALFELNFRSPVVRAQSETLLDGHVGEGRFPFRGFIRADDLNVAGY